MIGERILVLTFFCSFLAVAIEGRRVLLRPISAAEVHQILRDAGREDAIPEGRVVSQGIAAIKGFALGFKKGVVGVAIVDSLAALSSSSSSSSSNSTASSGGINKPSLSYNGTSNELCFTSRSSTSDIVGSGEGRKVIVEPTESVTMGTTPTSSTAVTTSPVADNTQTNTNTGSGNGDNTLSKTVTSTQTSGGAVNCIVINKP